MSALADLVALHFAREHRCCWVVELDLCGLLCGHDGEHVPYVPGYYLPPPLLHPVDSWRMAMDSWRAACGRPRRWPCPLCCQRVNEVRSDDGAGMYSVSLGDGETAQSYELHWSFRPCGCEAREILEDQQ